MKKPPLKPIEVNGINFPSHTLLAKVIGINKSTLHHRVDAGYKDADLLKRYLNRTEVTINNVTYESISEATRQTGIKETTIRRRLARGEKIGQPVFSGQTIVICGVEYESLNHAAKALNIPKMTLRNRFNKGLNDLDLVLGRRVLIQITLAKEAK